MGVEVKYNDTTIPNPIGKFRYTEEMGMYVFQQDFVVGTEGEIGAIGAAQETLFEALNSKNGNLEVNIGGSLWFDRSHDSNSGFLNEGKVAKNPEKSYGNKQVYTFTCSGKLPATRFAWNGAPNFFTEGGLLSVTIDVDYSPSVVQTVSFTGKYTATDSPSFHDAFWNYSDENTGAKKYAETWFSDSDQNIGPIASYDLYKQKITSGDQDKIADFALIYRYKTTDLNVEGVVLSKFDLVKKFDLEMNSAVLMSPSDKKAAGEGYATGTGTSGTGAPNPIDQPHYYSLDVSFMMDRTVYTTPKAIKDIYDSSLREWVVNYLKTAYGIADARVSAGKIEIDAQDWGLSINFDVLAPPGSKILMLEVQSTTDITTGEFAKKIADGKHFSYKIFSTGASANLAYTVSVVTIDQESPNEIFTQFSPGQLYTGTSGKGWRLMSVSDEDRQRFRQTINDETYELFYRSRVYSYMYVVDSEAAAPAIDLTDAKVGRNIFGGV